MRGKQGVDKRNKVTKRGVEEKRAKGWRKRRKEGERSEMLREREAMKYRAG